jgi:DNA/RNA-binding domain of Phe-tRNA-synthetase-like protein
VVEFRIAPEIGEHYPDLFVNLIVVRALDSRPDAAACERIVAYARSCEEQLRVEFPSKEALALDPRVQAYFEMFRTFGSNPKRMKPSHFALADRVIRGGELPDISPPVNLYNALSVRHLVPFGGEDLDTVADFFELGYATGEELWTPIGGTEPQSTRRGDVVWRDGLEVSTTSLNHRQCDKTKLTSKSRNVYFLSEGFRGVNDRHIDTMSAEFIAVFGDFLGGTYERFILTRESPTVRLSGVTS